MVNTHVRKFIVYISYFSQGGHKIPDRSNLKEEDLVFARNLKVHHGREGIVCRDCWVAGHAHTYGQDAVGD